MWPATEVFTTRTDGQTNKGEDNERMHSDASRKVTETTAAGHSKAEDKNKVGCQLKIEEKSNATLFRENDEFFSKK